MSSNTLQTAEIRPGDFHLRRDDRQMFGNYAVLSSAGGGDGVLRNLRRSAGMVETPVYDVPKLWRLRVLFELLPQFSSPARELAPWVPDGLGADNVRVTVRHALDRDKRVQVETFDLTSIHNGPDVQSAMPAELFVGHQVGVTVECRNPLSATPLGVQVSLVEVTDEGRDPADNARILSFVQSNVSQIILPANEKRRQLLVQNFGTAPMYVAFGLFANGPGIGARWTVALPNQGDIYESFRDGYRGDVAAVWGAADADGVGMVTETF